MRFASVIVPAAIISAAAASPVPEIVYVTNYITIIGTPPSSSASSSSTLSSSTILYNNTLLNSTNFTSSSLVSLTTQTPFVYSTVEVPAPAPAPATSEAAAPVEPTTEAQVTVAATSAAAAPTTTEAAATSEAAATTEASTTTANSGSGSLDGFALEMVNAHNAYRQLHQAPDLSWDLTLALYAQANADSYSCSGSLLHTGGPYGENLAAGYSSGLASVSAWYNEINDYDWSSTSTFNHFTQVVWKSTTKLGCAYKDCRSNNWGLYVICEYDPAGNMIGEVSENVLQ